MDDKDRTIRIQQNMLELYEKEKSKIVDSNLTSPLDAKSIETANCATQTERVSGTRNFEVFREIYCGSFNFVGATDVDGSRQFHEVIIALKLSLRNSKITLKVKRTFG